MWESAAPGGIPAAGRPGKALWLIQPKMGVGDKSPGLLLASVCPGGASWQDTTAGAVTLLLQHGARQVPGKAAGDVPWHYPLPRSLWQGTRLAWLRWAAPDPS